eukprot:scaffold1240_cov101-Isochrysis_galbana.AAC.19
MTVVGLGATSASLRLISSSEGSELIATPALSDAPTRLAAPALRLPLGLASPAAGMPAGACPSPPAGPSPLPAQALPAWPAGDHASSPIGFSPGSAGCHVSSSASALPPPVPTAPTASSASIGTAAAGCGRARSPGDKLARTCGGR